MKVICIVGMPGSGKSDVMDIFEKHGIPSFNMGDVITKIEPRKRGIKEINEQVESRIREEIRKELGPAAVAVRTAEEVRKFGKGLVAIGGLHTFAELEYFRKEFGDSLILVAVKCRPEVRMKRLSVRKERPLTTEDFIHREKKYSEIFDVAKFVEMAELSIDNNGTRDKLAKQAEDLIARIKKA